MKHTIYQLFSITISTIIMAFALNDFLIPHKVLTGGVTGISIIIHQFIRLNTGSIILIINIPLFILGYFKLGKKFMFLTIYSIVLLSIAMKLIPVSPFSHDILSSCIFGGVLFGLCVGMNIKFGGSSGGLDIVSVILSKKKDMSIGYLSTYMNLGVVIVSALVFGTDKTLYTLFAIFASGRAVDTIYTNQVKLTVTIVTEKWNELSEALLHLHQRGITMTEAEGVYSHHPKKVLTTVITKFEWQETKELIRKEDPKAFVHITRAIEVMGRFRKE
ncbi:MAG: YitT family protein [Bacillota bacterium]|nr:YitT family protein [Bacillota bacterium]